jgi:hypothetical protein
MTAADILNPLLTEAMVALQNCTETRIGIAIAALPQGADRSQCDVAVVRAIHKHFMADALMAFQFALSEATGKEAA